jgi:hypothetical protein
MYAELFELRRRLRQGRGIAGTLKVCKRQARRSLVLEWQEELAAVPPSSSGHSIVGAICPRLEAWIDRGWGNPSFHLSQVLTGHGCFGRMSRLRGGAPCSGPTDWTRSLSPGRHRIDARPGGELGGGGLLPRHNGAAEGGHREGKRAGAKWR